ncbi:MAG: tRNA preQ1(34) S-adenosylmethionine ribosyltransferase-isomerase QueA [Bacillota bacterium]|nr:tRNA preQ1(34) S-adenosylmethionine ribosyltransferase-isomerase QueA [Bacillota bacterium]
MQLALFDYSLPDDLVAQEPAEPRDSCRLLVLCRQDGRIRHYVFRELPEILAPGDCVVLNDTRVIPARLHGTATPPCAVEVLLLRPLEGRLCWEALVKPGRRLRPGVEVDVGAAPARLLLTERLPGGKWLVRFVGIDDDGVASLLRLRGEMPVPPYIKARLKSPEHYQTVYSRVEGSVAAPTAGLHFTPALLRALVARDILPVFVRLHVGYGTFQPLRSETIEDHRMEQELFEVGEPAAREIAGRRRAGGRVVAVGTTVTRTLETAYSTERRAVRACSGASGLFIYPGWAFQAIDGLLTNFHLPKSTPLLLTAAMAGWPALSAAYSAAVSLRYRFYSFGDGMLVL